jgi:hypothetical protein
VLLNATNFYLKRGTCFDHLLWSDHPCNILKYGKNAIHVNSSYGLYSVESRKFAVLLHYKIVKSGNTVANGCKFIVGFGTMYSDKHKMLNCKIELLNITCMHKSTSATWRCRSDGNTHTHTYIPEWWIWQYEVLECFYWCHIYDFLGLSHFIIVWFFYEILVDI